MFDVNELLSKRNQRDAMDYFEIKKADKKFDGMDFAEFQKYWNNNKDKIEDLIKEGNYFPDSIKSKSIVTGSGKERSICLMSYSDKFITRLLAQKLNRYLSEVFQSNSYAYQENKSTLDAVHKASEYIFQGDKYVVEIDLKNFFDNINLEHLTEKIEEIISDEKVRLLINRYLYCFIAEEGGKIRNKTVGIIQGSAISPVLSNLYLHDFDLFLEDKSYHWIRFADDIRVYCKDGNTAQEIYSELYGKLKNDFLLPINEEKSGIYKSTGRRLLGYDFITKGNRIDYKKHDYKEKRSSNKWTSSQLEIIGDEYHILDSGVINKQDFSLMFVNGEIKRDIPIEHVKQLNIYSNVVLTSSAIAEISKRNILICIINRYGEQTGIYFPERNKGTNKTLLNQTRIFLDEDERKTLARKFEISYLHNIRANLRYYNKHNIELTNEIAKVTENMIKIREATTIDHMMLIEAETRQMYYSAFNKILKNKDFVFKKRTKRPPQDAINALISFGNTLLYSEILKRINMTTLNPRISFVHSPVNRSVGLQYDIADIFKPIIVDRVIFSLVNKGQINSSHFSSGKSNAVLLNDEGKRLFIQKFEDKINTKVVINNKEITYGKLITDELNRLIGYINNGKKYIPYKYY